MKKGILLAFSFLFSMALMAQGPQAPAQPTPASVAKFNKEAFDFAKIPQGTPVTTYFEFKNISKAPIVVESVSASCGCTTPEKPEAPIAPGATGKIKVGYNAASVGTFSKPIYVKFAGINESITVTISGEVVNK